MSNIVTAIFQPGYTAAKVLGVWQYDYGQILRIQGLELPNAVVVHFSLKEKDGTSVTRIGITQDHITEVSIPDACLENSDSAMDYNIYAFIYISDEKCGNTEYKISIKVRSRPKPEIPGTPSDPEIFGQTIDIVNKAMENTKKYSESAAKSETAALEAATQAEESKKISELSAAQARESASAASVSESNAAKSERIAREQATSANTASQKAAESSIDAGKSASASAASEQAAKASERNAASSAESASAYAEQAVSAADSAGKASTVAASAAYTATQASGSASESATQAGKSVESAAQSAETARQKATTAETAASNAAESATAAEKSATAAGESATAAKASETAATASAVTATEQAEKIKASAEQIEKNRAGVAALKESVANKITKFYANNLGEMHITDSDSGKVQDMMVYGKSEQKKYQGYQLLEHNTAEYKFTATTSYYELVYNAPENIKSGVYYLRKLENTPTVLITFLNASKKMVKQEYLTDKTEKRIVFETDVAYVKYIIQNLTVGTDYKGTVKLILASTSGADYEPYVGGIPSPNPDYPQEIKSVVNPVVRVVGKNLFDQAKVFKNIDIAIRDIIGLDCRNIVGKKSQRRYYLIECKPNTKYHITFVNPTNNIFIGIADKNYIGIKNIATFETFTSRIFTTSNDANFIVLNADATSDICLSTDDVDYEPYTEQSVQLPCTLNAIPVSSGGNVTIDGQEYIADYVDVERGKLVKCIEQIDHSSVTKLMLEGIDKDRIMYRATQNYASKLRCKPSKNIIDSIECTHLILSKSTDFTDKNMFCIFEHTSWNYTRIRFSNFINATSRTEFEDWLVNHPEFKAIYPLAAPTEIDLTPEEIAAFKALATYYPVTNIGVTSEQLDGMTVFNYPISLANGWNYVKQQLNDNRDYIYNMDLQSAEAYVNSEYAVALTELEVM